MRGLGVNEGEGNGVIPTKRWRPSSTGHELIFKLEFDRCFGSATQQCSHRLKPISKATSTLARRSRLEAAPMRAV